MIAASRVLTIAIAIAIVVAADHSARADDTVDVAAAEMLDVIETTDGSIWRGVIVEQTPNESYRLATSDGGIRVIRTHDVARITKQRNKARRTATLDEEPAESVATVGTASTAGSGVRFDPSLSIVIPMGDLDQASTSFAPGIRVGYEQVFGNVGLAGGILGRFIPWQVPAQFPLSVWSLETHAFTRASYHAGIAAPYVGVSLGLDINHPSVDPRLTDGADVSETVVGFGLNLQGGIAIVPTKSVAFDIGVDFHPGTDSLAVMLAGNGNKPSVSYFAFTLGVSLRP